MTEVARASYVIVRGVGSTRPVAPEREGVAREIDRDGDAVLTRTEVKAYLQKPSVDIWRGQDGVTRDDDAVYGEFVRFMEGKRPVAEPYYQTVEEMAAELEQLEHTYPNLPNACKSARRPKEGRSTRSRSARTWAIPLRRVGRAF